MVQLPAGSLMPALSSLTRPDGATIAYRRSEGAPPGVVFLGGFHSDMTGVKASYLEDYCRRRGRACLRFDHFGHGASSGDITRGTIGRWAEDAIAVLDELTLGPQILVGPSMGGWVMLLTALARPSRIRALIGIAPAPDFTEDLLWPRLDEAQRRSLLETGAVTLASDYDSQGYTYRRELIEDGKRHLLLRGPIALDCPVRLLHGLDDASVPWRTSVRLAECLAGTDVTVTLVKGGDHRLSAPADLARLAAILDALIVP
jgi:pimeloyl-ACP methyl ester carboxylesterase